MPLNTNRTGMTYCSSTQNCLDVQYAANARLAAAYLSIQAKLDKRALTFLHNIEYNNIVDVHKLKIRFLCAAMSQLLCNHTWSLVKVLQFPESF